MAARMLRPGALAFAEEIVRPMFTFLLVIHALIAAALVTVILMQRSEGGGLGMGGGPAGLMTARGAADFLTRATSVLATLFVIMAFVLATYASMRNSGGKIDTSLEHQAAPGPITAPMPAALPATGIPMMGAPAAAPATAAPAPMATAPEVRQARPVPTAANLKTIDTAKVTSNSGNIGIGGVTAGHAARKPAPTPATSTPAPAPAAAKPVPTLNIAPPAPAAPSDNGSSSQPQ